MTRIRTYLYIGIRTLKRAGCACALILLFILAPSAAHAASLVRAATGLGLQTYWSFNEGTGLLAHDFSGNGNTGTLTNSPTWVTGKLGYGLSFNGSNQYVVDTKVINDTQATISIWVKFSSNPSSTGLIAGFVNGLAGPQYDKELLLGTNGKVTWYVFDGSAKSAVGNTVITDGKWHHIVGTANGTNAILYVDGVQDGTIAAGSTYAGYTLPDVFVNGASGNGTYLAGSGDDCEFITGHSRRAKSQRSTNQVSQL